MNTSGLDVVTSLEEERVPLGLGLAFCNEAGTGKVFELELWCLAQVGSRPRSKLGGDGSARTVGGSRSPAKRQFTGSSYCWMVLTFES